MSLSALAYDTFGSYDLTWERVADVTARDIPGKARHIVGRNDAAVVELVSDRADRRLLKLNVLINTTGAGASLCAYALCLCAQFDRADADAYLAKLARVAADAPGDSITIRDARAKAVITWTYARTTGMITLELLLR
jgi:hypothetical protein